MFDKLKDFISGSFLRVFEVIPGLADWVRGREIGDNSPEDVQQQREAISALRSLLGSLDGALDVWELALDEDSPGGEDFTIGEGETFAKRLQTLRAEVDAAVDELKDIF